jgi:hypothetical protein
VPSEARVLATKSNHDGWARHALTGLADDCQAPDEAFAKRRPCGVLKQAPLHEVFILTCDAQGAGLLSRVTSDSGSNGCSWICRADDAGSPQSALNSTPDWECAPEAGQIQAATLTVRRTCCSSNCTALR